MVKPRRSSSKRVSSAKEATKAAKVLKNPHSSKSSKSLAASVLSQAKSKRK